VELVDDRHGGGIGIFHAAEDQCEMQSAHEEHRWNQHTPLSARHGLEPGQQTHQYKDESERGEEYRGEMADSDLARHRVQPPRDANDQSKKDVDRTHGSFRKKTIPARPEVGQREMSNNSHGY